MKVLATLFGVLILAAPVYAQLDAADAPPTRIDVTSFNALRAEGKARIVESRANEIVVGYKQWDLNQATRGALVELPERVTAQPRQELLDRKAALQAQIAQIDALLAAAPAPR
jgi:hypothetical protein